MLRRDAIRALLATSTAAALGAPLALRPTRALAAGAEGWPARPIRIISPFPPGGGTDYIARLLASQLGEARGWTCVVENRTGANGTLGLTEAARAPAQGYDFVVAQKDNSILGPLLMPVSFDPVKDFTPVGMMGTTPIVILVASNSPLRSFNDLVEAARKAPGKISFGTSGTGSVSHITSELLHQRADVALAHIPYKGSNPAMVDLLGGHVDLVGGSIASAIPFLREGRMRALAVSTQKRSPRLPEVPTIAELGFKDFEVTAWWGLMGPAGLPAAITTAMNQALNEALARPQAVQGLLDQGIAVETGTPADFARYVTTDYATWKDIVASTGVRLN